MEKGVLAGCPDVPGLTGLSHWRPGCEQGRTRVSAFQIPPGPLLFLWLQSGVSTERVISSLERGHTSQGRIRQYLFGTIGGNKPACPSPAPPLQQFPMAVREMEGEMPAASCPGAAGYADGKPRLVSHPKPLTPVHVSMEIQWHRGKPCEGGVGMEQQG